MICCSCSSHWTVFIEGGGGVFLCESILSETSLLVDFFLYNGFVVSFKIHSDSFSIDNRI